MPYILLKQSTLAPGLLQTLDLMPNTSIREDGYAPIGQTGYRRAVSNDPVDHVGGVVAKNSTGLAAWFLSEINDGTSAAAVGMFTAVSVLAGHTATITTAPAKTFLAVAGARTSGGLDFDISGGDAATATDLAAAINDDANWSGVTRPVSAAADGNVVTVTALADGTAGNYVLAQTGGTIAVEGMVGGLDAAALTGAQAVVDATDVLTLLNYDAAAAAGALDLATVNGALTTGTLTAAQHTDMLDILAGRNFRLEAGAVVETVGVWAAGAGSFIDNIRRIYDGSPLRISFGEGRLSKIVPDDWSDDGAAVAVYNDDGTLYVG